VPAYTGACGPPAPRAKASFFLGLGRARRGDIKGPGRRVCWCSTQPKTKTADDAKSGPGAPRERVTTRNEVNPTESEDRSRFKFVLLAPSPGLLKTLFKRGNGPPEGLWAVKETKVDGDAKA